MNVGGNNETDGCLSQRGIDYFVERAKGGTGMIVTGAVRVTREFERDNTVIPVWMLFADHMVHGKWISQLAERCHDYGTSVCIQLTCGGGRIAGGYAQEHGLAIGPSANPCLSPPHNYTRPLTKEEIKKFVEAFYQAARLIKNAGADAIQIHGHQGYLIDQFTTSLWNHRTDEYGGSLENRLRFPKELIEAIKRGAGSDFPVIYRYGLTHYLEGGRTIEEGVEMAKLLESYGVDALDIDSGCYENNYYPHPPSTIPCGSFSYLAGKVKQAVSIPVISSTRIGYPDIAEGILEKGEADFVSLGRPLIADPYWCEKAKKGELDSIRPCIACHEGCLRRLMVYKSVSCAVNPQAGDENYLQVCEAQEKKKAVVIGGGIAGMVAAITLRKRGHEVVLFEKDEELGGIFKSPFLPSFKDDYRKYIQYLTKKLKESGATIMLGTEAIPAIIMGQNPDIIVNAVGASFKYIPLQGLNENMLTNPFSLYEDKRFDGKRVVIIGGGLVGVEAAINVALKGGIPFIIEKTPRIAASAYPLNRQHLEKLLVDLSVRVYLNTNVLKVEGQVISIKTPDEEQLIEFDIISECVGVKSNELDFIECNTVITVGDADKPLNVMNAVWTAYRKCRVL
jgi:2-enoate reductase